MVDVITVGQALQLLLLVSLLTSFVGGIISIAPESHFIQERTGLGDEIESMRKVNSVVNSDEDTVEYDEGFDEAIYELTKDCEVSFEIKRIYKKTKSEYNQERAQRGGPVRSG